VSKNDHLFIKKDSPMKTMSFDVVKLGTFNFFSTDAYKRHFRYCGQIQSKWCLYVGRIIIPQSRKP